MQTVLQRLAGVHRLILLALAGPAFAAGCGGAGGPPGEVRGQREWPARNAAVAVLQGRVTGPGGQPVANAAVEVTAVYTEPPGDTRMGDCSGTPGPAERARTDANGEFRVTLSAGAGPERNACVTVRVQPPAGSRLAERTLSGRPVAFRATAVPPEPVRIDVSLVR